MAITKEIKIKHINVQDLKTLQIIGATQVMDGDELIAEQEYAFGLQPDQNPSDIKAYQALPESEKTKVDELTTPLWTDAVKANFAAFRAAQDADK
jgi:hypothetical protein